MIPIQTLATHTCAFIHRTPNEHTRTAQPYAYLNDRTFFSFFISFQQMTPINTLSPTSYSCPCMNLTCLIFLPTNQIHPIRIIITKPSLHPFVLPLRNRSSRGTLQSTKQTEHARQGQMLLTLLTAQRGHIQRRTSMETLEVQASMAVTVPPQARSRWTDAS